MCSSDLGFTLLGPLSRESYHASGTHLDVVRVGAAARATLPLGEWLGGGLAAMRTLDPATPLPRVQVIVAPGHRGADGVGFGWVSRGGGRSVMFTIDPEAPAEAFRRDWQATHEFIHFLQPVFVDDDAWLGEGLATYYQEVLRARTGAISPARCWANLVRGLREIGRAHV